MEHFREIYEANVQEVYRFLLSLCRDEHLAEELTQETFVKAIERIDTFRGDCKISVWLCQIGKHLFYRQYQKGKHRAELEPEHLDPILQEPSPEGDLLRSAESSEILRHLHTLEEPYKEVFTLRALGEVPYAQISALFGKTESWARVTYHRARLLLTERMNKEGTL